MLKAPKLAAVLTIRDAGNMTAAGRKNIAAWLTRQANFLIKYNKELSKIHTVRYLYK